MTPIDIVDDLVNANRHHVQPLQELLSVAAHHIQEQDQRIHALQKALGETLARELAVAESWDGKLYAAPTAGNWCEWIDVPVDIGKTLREDLKLEPKNG